MLIPGFVTFSGDNLPWKFVFQIYKIQPKFQEWKKGKGLLVANPGLKQGENL